MNFHRFVGSLGLVLVLLASEARAQPGSIFLGMNSRPESITKGWNGKFYVTLQGPSGALGTFDGQVVEVDIRSGIVTPFVMGLENPRGITFTGRYLVVADQVKIFKIDRHKHVTLLATGAQLPFQPVPPATVFFNDAAAEEGGEAVYISEMGRRDLIRVPPPPPQVLIPVDSPAAFAIPATSRVYRIGLDGGIKSVFEPSRKLLVINGVTEVKKRRKLLVLDFFFGSVVDVDLKKGTKTILATALRGADGVEQAEDGTIFVSSFELGAVWRMDEDGENLQALITDVGFQTTADFYLDERAKLLYVPNTAAGTIMVISTEP